MRAFIGVILLVFVCDAGAVSASETVIGTVKTVNGTASIIRNQETLPVKIGIPLYENDVITTAGNGSMGVTFKDNSLLSIGSDSRLAIDKFTFQPEKKRFSMVAKMMRGTAVYLGGLISKLKPKSVQFVTPTAVLGVRGTHFAIKVRD